MPIQGAPPYDSTVPLLPPSSHYTVPPPPPPLVQSTPQVGAFVYMGVIAIASKSLQVEGRMVHGCEISLGCENVVILLQNLAAILHSAAVINFVDYSLLRSKIKGHQLDTNQMAPLSGPLSGHESAETPIGNELDTQAHIDRSEQRMRLLHVSDRVMSWDRYDDFSVANCLLSSACQILRDTWGLDTPYPLAVVQRCYAQAQTR
ncbi:hypothetical protein CK203_049333 [Vitis vinifera]|uniref:Uncharacterized protein n=1 Tax=Vitis vinifera TaxID=29760 RepID=A0A438FVI6_VITVI|nr:hypothetical protein CK203_049333 [Vitis vinifera]